MVENQHRLIKGYRELSEIDIGVINKIKELANAVGEVVDGIEDLDSDMRWVAIARTDLQKGFMALIRAIAQPESF